jgi:hypothetical protein
MKCDTLRYEKPSKPAGLTPLEQAEKEVFRRAFKANDGVLSRVAAVLDLNIITARKRAIKYGLWRKGQD